MLQMGSWIMYGISLLYIFKLKLLFFSWGGGGGAVVVVSMIYSLVKNCEGKGTKIKKRT